MAAKSTLRNMVLCLTLVCLFCSAVLAVVYAITADPIKAAEQKALRRAIAANDRPRHIVAGNLDQPRAKCKKKQIALFEQLARFHNLKETGGPFRPPVA